MIFLNEMYMSYFHNSFSYLEVIQHDLWGLAFRFVWVPPISWGQPRADLGGMSAFAAD